MSLKETSENILNKINDHNNEKVGQCKNITNKSWKKFWNKMQISNKSMKRTISNAYWADIICITPIVSKVCERIIKRHLFQYIEIFSSSPLCGYSEGFSTQSAHLGLA